jgi:chemotaxis protein MotB
MKKLIGLVMLVVVMSACVGQKKYNDLQSRVDQYETELQASERSLVAAENQILVLETDLGNAQSKVNYHEQQLEYFKSTNTDLLARLSDLAVVSKTGAESIKKSLEALNEQNRYIKDMTSSMQRKDSLNLVLVMNLKRSLAEFDDEDIDIEVKKGVVYVSISDKMLFQSGSYQISNRAHEVIGKIASIVNDHDQLDILVEGHTDHVPIANECMVDNWDLSVKRATSIVRLMQTKFGVAPERMTAGGRSEFIPKATNETVKGRALNRRTEIIILPKLDEFFELLSPPETLSSSE